jgi:hypothetical protein
VFPQRVAIRIAMYEYNEIGRCWRLMGDILDVVELDAVLEDTEAVVEAKRALFEVP